MPRARPLPVLLSEPPLVAALMPTMDVPLRRVLAEDRDHAVLLSVRACRMADGRVRLVLVAQGRAALDVLQGYGLAEAALHALNLQLAEAEAEALVAALERAAYPPAEGAPALPADLGCPAGTAPSD